MVLRQVYYSYVNKCTCTYFVCKCLPTCICTVLAFVEMGIAWLYCEPVDMCLCVALSHLSVHAVVDVYGSNLRTCDFAGLCVCSGTCIYLRGYARPDTVGFFLFFIF